MNSNVYDQDFFAQQREVSARSAAVVAPRVCEWVRPASVVDVGCGIGAWLAAFREQGVRDVVGLDGHYVDRQKLLFPVEAFTPADLENPPPLGRHFDLAVCLEVVEHLPRSVGERLIRYLADLAPVILFSAAVPGQPGTHHVGAEWPDRWQGKFAALGYVALDPIRPLIWHDERVALHYRQNLLLFVRESRLAPGSVLSGLPRANCLTLIDQDILRLNLGLGAGLRRLPAQLWKLISRRRF